MNAKGIVFKGTHPLCVRSGPPCPVMLLCGAGNPCFLEGWPVHTSSSGERNSGISPVLERLEENDGAVLQGGATSLILLLLTTKRVWQINQKSSVFWASCYSLSTTCQQPPLRCQAKVLALSPVPCFTPRFANVHECKVLKFRFMVPKFMVLRINKKPLWWLRAGYPINPESWIFITLDYKRT